jgi:hypothetical protein
MASRRLLFCSTVVLSKAWGSTPVKGTDTCVWVKRGALVSAAILHFPYSLAQFCHVLFASLYCIHPAELFLSYPEREFLNYRTWFFFYLLPGGILRMIPLLPSWKIPSPLSKKIHKLNRSKIPAIRKEDSFFKGRFFIYLAGRYLGNRLRLGRLLSYPAGRLLTVANP